jgi:hypothetical protein
MGQRFSERMWIEVDPCMGISVSGQFLGGFKAEAQAQLTFKLGRRKCKMF